MYVRIRFISRTMNCSSQKHSYCRQKRHPISINNLCLILLLRPPAFNTRQTWEYLDCGLITTHCGQDPIHWPIVCAPIASLFHYCLNRNLLMDRSLVRVNGLWCLVAFGTGKSVLRSGYTDLRWLAWSKRASSPCNISEKSVICLGLVPSATTNATRRSK